MLSNQTNKVMYLIICATPLASHLYRLIEIAQSASWDVCIILTPQAVKFVDCKLLEEKTGHPVRSDYKQPTQEDILPKADAILVCPATFNTLNKWALGIADTLALSILCEALGKRIPITAIAHMNTDLANHPIFSQHIALLQNAGVHVVPKSEVPSEGMSEYILNEFTKTGMRRKGTRQQASTQRPIQLLEMAKIAGKAFLKGFSTNS